MSSIVPRNYPKTKQPTLVFDPVQHIRITGHAAIDYALKYERSLNIVESPQTASQVDVDPALAEEICTNLGAQLVWCLFDPEQILDLLTSIVVVKPTFVRETTSTDVVAHTPVDDWNSIYIALCCDLKNNRNLSRPYCVDWDQSNIKREVADVLFEEIPQEAMERLLDLAIAGKLDFTQVFELISQRQGKPANTEPEYDA